MLLAIDIGNTNIVMGGWRDGHWIHHWRIRSDRERTGDEYDALIRNLFRDAGIDFSDVERIIIGSVVPGLTLILQEILSERCNCTPFLLDHTTDTGISIDTDHPSAVGADLIAGAAAAWHRYRETCIIVDFGTATTITTVTKDGSFRGGAICAGLNVSVNALVEKAAKLSQIPLAPPTRITAGNTEEAMQSGLFVGHICMVEGLVERMKKENGPARIIATGGLAELLAPHTGCFDTVDPMLILDGLQLIMERRTNHGDGGG